MDSAGTPDLVELRPPGNGQPLDGVQTQLREEAEERRGDEAAVHRFDRERLPGLPDEIADARFGADELGGDYDDQGHAQGELEAGEDLWHSARDGNRSEELPATGAEVPSDIQVDLFDIHHAGHGVDEHQEDNANGHTDVLGHFAQAEDEHDQRQDGD